jgi:hypothetical protein
MTILVPTLVPSPSSAGCWAAAGIGPAATMMVRIMSRKADEIVERMIASLLYMAKSVRLVTLD